MNTILISGTIGSGKSSILKNKKFLRRFAFPQKFLSADILGKNAYHSRISHFSFQKNPYLRRCIRQRNGKISLQKNVLKKQLFYTPEKTRNFYWNSLEKILHPQIFQKIFKNIVHVQKKKGTLFIECAVPQRIFSTRDFRDKIEREIKISGTHSVLKLILFRGLSPREISGFLKRQGKR